MNNEELKKIPQVEQLMNEPRVSCWFEKISRPLTAASVRKAIDHYRGLLKEGRTFRDDELFKLIDRVCGELHNKRIRPVINATGVVLHTNMGRSPILDEVWESCKNANTGYSNLELSLKTGRRGKRNGLIPLMIQSLTGAESCAVVNNNAAAIYLVLNAFAKGKEVIVSRGEQVQIGGGFRIPDILEASGARLVEVGTTNITTLEDYTSALTPDTAMVLKVHRSNFALRGFTSEPSVQELTAALPEDVLTIVDQGSGVMNENIPGEQNVRAHIAAGADIVTFSCDKFPGGPQGGIIAGRTELIQAVDKHPLIRTMRPGKTVYSLLEATLVQRMNNEGSFSRHAAFVTNGEETADKCKKIKRGLSTEKFKLADDTQCIGGGSTPDEFFESKAIEICSDKLKPGEIIKMLREADPPVIGTIKKDRALLNPAALEEEEIKTLKSILKELEERL